MDDKPRIPGISIEAQEIMRRMSEMKVGDFVNYEELSQIAMGDVQSEKRFAVNTARRALRRDGMVFGCVIGKGYKRLNDAEKVKVASKARGHIQNTARDAMKTLAAVEFDKLSNAEKIKHNAEFSVLGVLNHMAKPMQMKRIEGRVAVTQSRLQLKDTLKEFEKAPKLEIVREKQA